MISKLKLIKKYSSDKHHTATYLPVSSRIYKFENKFFRGSVNIHKNPQNILCWKVSHLTLYNGEIDIVQQECKSCLPVVDAIRLMAADS